MTTPTYVYGGTILADGRLTLVINGAASLQHILNQGQAASSLGMIRAPIGSVRPALLSDGKPTVMIVDDSITLRHALVFTLQQAGYKTCACS